MIDHASKFSRRNTVTVVEVGPSRWEAILWIAVAGPSLYFTLMYLLSYGH